MSFFKTKAKIVKVIGGVLKDKYVIVAKEYDKGYGVIPEATEWPPTVPEDFNAIYVHAESVVECSEEEQTLLRIKFPNPEQFE